MPNRPVTRFLRRCMQVIKHVMRRTELRLIMWKMLN